MRKQKIYLDTCCYNRPFDDQTDDRIHLESESIIFIIRMFDKKELEIIGSEVIDYEISLISNSYKRQKVYDLASIVHEKLEIDGQTESLALDYEKSGLKAFDALHVAVAEVNNLDYLITTDKKMISISRRIPDLSVRIISPIDFVKEYIDEN